MTKARPARAAQEAAVDVGGGGRVEVDHPVVAGPPGLVGRRARVVAAPDAPRAVACVAAVIVAVQKGVDAAPAGEHLAQSGRVLQLVQRPGVERVVVQVHHSPPTIKLHESNDREVALNSQQMSDGVLRLLAIASLLYVEHLPTVLTFEEPENGMHPQLLREVVQLLRDLTHRKPPNRCQVFFSTHSPYVLDEFFDHPEQVYCMDRPKPQEGTRIVRLSDNRQLDLARATFGRSLGEAWTTGRLGSTAGLRAR